MLRHVRYTASTLAIYTGATPGLCVHPPPVHTVHHLWPHSQTPREFYSEACGWHHHHRLQYKQRWVFMLGHNLTERCTEINLLQCRQNQGGKHPCLHQWNWGGAGKKKEKKKKINKFLGITYTKNQSWLSNRKGSSSYGKLGLGWVLSFHQLLHRRNRKHPDWKHQKLAWSMHIPGQEGSTAGD